MTTLALFWPMPGLAELGDPLDHVRRHGGPADPGGVLDAVQRRIAEAMPPIEPSSGGGAPPEQWTWPPHSDGLDPSRTGRWTRY
jgi:hypothetical protein